MSLEEQYVLAVVQRHRGRDDGRPERLRGRVAGLLRHWKFGQYLECVTISGSHAKSTALRDSDVDLFLSLSPETTGPVSAVHESLAEHFRDYLPRPRNVSVRIYLDGSRVDLTPGRRREGSTHHTLWQRRYETWLQTDIAEQIRYIRSAGLMMEMLAVKAWRRRQALRFPSFVLELATIRALLGQNRVGICGSLKRTLEFLATAFTEARILDPGNSNNVVSAALTVEEKCRIAAAAEISLRAESWTEVV